MRIILGYNNRKAKLFWREYGTGILAIAIFFLIYVLVSTSEYNSLMVMAGGK